MTVREASV